MMGAASGAVAAGYSTVAKAASDSSVIAIEEVKPSEDVSRPCQPGQRQILISPSISRSSAPRMTSRKRDQAIGVGAKDEGFSQKCRALPGEYQDPRSP